MDVVHHNDAAVFLALAGEFLLQNEAEHNLLFSIAQSVVDDPSAYEGFDSWTASDRGVVQGVATMTSPFNVIVSRMVPGAVIPLIEAVLDSGMSVPGVVGNDPFGYEFAGELGRRLGRMSEITMSQGVFELLEVCELQTPEGSMETLGPEDQDWVLEWVLRFSEEAMRHRSEHTGRLARSIEKRLSAATSSGMVGWRHRGEIVSLSGHQPGTPNGFRVGPVYTPPELRGSGFATALVAAQSQMLLDAGSRFCFLYTDLANPTSNAIYRRIGYRRIVTSKEVSFVSES